MITVTVPSAGYLRVLVSAGDGVDAGQTVAVVEAMKMESPIAAPISGRVQEVHRGNGPTEGGDELLTIADA